VTACHVSQLGGTVQVLAGFDGVVRQNVVRRQTKLCSAIKRSKRVITIIGALVAAAELNPSSVVDERRLTLIISFNR